MSEKTPAPDVASERVLRKMRLPGQAGAVGVPVSRRCWCPTDSCTEELSGSESYTNGAGEQGTRVTDSWSSSVSEAESSWQKCLGDDVFAL